MFCPGSVFSSNNGLFSAPSALRDQLGYKTNILEETQVFSTQKGFSVQPYLQLYRIILYRLHQAINKKKSMKITTKCQTRQGKIILL